MALRTVPWLTGNREASSSSLGIASPGFHSPRSSPCRIRPLICWYRGLNAALWGARLDVCGRSMGGESDMSVRRDGLVTMLQDETAHFRTSGAGCLILFCLI